MLTCISQFVYCVEFGVKLLSLVIANVTALAMSIAYNVTLKCVRATNVAVEGNVLHTLGVCFRLSYPT